jgi:hypothetical protein
MHCGSENESQAVDDVQPFEADGIFYPWLSWLFCLQFEEDLDAYGSDHQEYGRDELCSNTKMRKVLVPLAEWNVR